MGLVKTIHTENDPKKMEHSLSDINEDTIHLHLILNFDPKFDRFACL